MNKKALYESIMRSVAKEVKKALNESTYNSLFGSLQANIDGIKIDKNTIYIDNFDDAEYIEDGEIIWTADIKPCMLKGIKINGRVINKTFSIDGGNVKGMTSVDEINDMFGTEYYDIDEIPEDRIEKCIKKTIGNTVNFYIQGTVEQIFDTDQLESADTYPNEFTDIIYGEDRVYMTNASGVCNARITSKDIVNEFVNTLNKFQA